MVSLYKQATFPTLQLVTGWWTSNPIKTHQLAFSNMAFFQKPSWSVSTVSWFRQSLLSPPLLIFPLCARPGHLYQSARPTSKEKSIHRWRLGHSCYSCHAWWFSRAGCRIFQKQLCASGADSTPGQKGFYLYSFPPLRKKRKKTHLPLPYPPSAFLACCPDLLKLQTPPEISALSPSPQRNPAALQRSFQHLQRCRIIFHLLHIPTKEKDEGGEVLPFWLYDYIMTEQHTCMFYSSTTRGVLHLIMPGYKCAFVGYHQADRRFWFQGPILHFPKSLTLYKYEINLEP